MTKEQLLQREIYDILREPENQKLFIRMMAEMITRYVMIARRAKHGRWIEDEYEIPHCSECNAINNTVYRNYCPNCGAKMEDNNE